MALYGIIDNLRANILSGWAQLADERPQSITVEIDGQKVSAPVDRLRPDLSAFPNRHGFEIALPRHILASELLSGAVVAFIDDGATRASMNVVQPIQAAARIEQEDGNALKRAARFVSSSRRALLQDTFGPVEPWRQLTTKQICCVVTYANGAGAWFPYFYDYYSAAVGATNIVVVTPRPEEFSDYELGSVVGMRGFPYDDNALAQFRSYVANAFRAYYDWVCSCDVDEILVPDPRSGLGFIEQVQALEHSPSVSRGFDVMQSADEAEFDFSRTIFSQRRFAAATSSMSKPHFTRSKVAWDIGFHFSDQQPAFEKEGTGFITLHLKWACNAIRRSVAKLVAETSYSEADIEAYAKKIGEIEPHPLLRQNVPVVPMLDPDRMAAFEREMLDSFSFRPEQMFWAGKHFYPPVLFDLSVFADS